MKLFFKITTIFLILTLASCGGDGSDDVGACSALKIASGETCESKENPVVLLEMYKADGTSYVCSGSIITRTSVITAAHCLVGFNRIIVNHRNASMEAQEGFYNGLYQKDVVGPYDIAILKVSTEFTDAANFSPLPLNFTQDVYAGETLTIFGFGKDENDNISTDYPKAAYVTFAGMTDNMLTAIGLSGFARGGDSGGPIVYNKSLLGVLSGGNDELQTNFYASIRESSNYNFIMAIAPDVATKSEIKEAIDNNVAVKWTPTN